MTVFTPRIALRKEPGSDRSPSAICTRTRSGPSRRGSRTKQRTRCPSAVSRRSSAEPTLPVAPVSRITSGGGGSASEPVALFLPRVRVVVVAVQLPEPHPVGRHQLELAQKLGRLPEVAFGHDQPQRRAMVGLERLAVE